MKPFRIRCSAIGKLMSGSMDLTEKQYKRIEEFKQREAGTFLAKNGKPLKLSDANKKEWEDLLKQRDEKRKELPQGAKTYIEDHFKGYLYDMRKQFSSRYTDKGNLAEDKAINYVVEQLGLGFGGKNSLYLENEFVHGTPDIILLPSVDDIKCSWDCFSFPLFESENPKLEYQWQLDGYMWLCEKRKARLHYCLMDAPDDMIEEEAKRRSYWKSNSTKTYDEIYDKVKKEMTYSDLPVELRLKTFEFEYNQSRIDQIKERVLLARKYIIELSEKFGLTDIAGIDKLAA